MPGERRPQYANDFNKDDILQVLLALQGKVNRELHVATLCVITDKVSDNAYRCYALPKSKGKDAMTFNAICIRKHDRDLIDAAIAESHVFAIAIITDFDAQANYEHALQTNDASAIDSTSTMHAMNNALIAYVGDRTDGQPLEGGE